MAIKGRKTAMSAEDNKIGGLNVYHDEKGRPVYLNRMNHVGYVLTDKTKPFRTYSSRFFIGGIAAIFAYMFELPLIMCIFLGIAAYALMEFKFRKSCRLCHRYQISNRLITWERYNQKQI